MKNYEKYATPNEAWDAFKKYCWKTNCKECPFFEFKMVKMSCSMMWLYSDDNKNPTPQWQENLMEKFTSKE